MGTYIGGGSSVSHHLRVAERELRDLLKTSVATTFDQSELAALDEQACKVISLIRFGRNRLVPVNQLPPDVLTLIPNFWYEQERDKIVIVLTHVCRAWRDVFVSHASFWTNFFCVDAGRTRTYLERSRSSPINLFLQKRQGLLPNDPFLEIPSDTLGRLKRVSVTTTPEHLQDITKCLVHAAPLLETLIIDCHTISRQGNPTLTVELFDGDFSSLRELQLYSVRTQLPWRNMDNLALFSLNSFSGPSASVGQILDFLEGAPRLRRITLSLITSTIANAQPERLVALPNLNSAYIVGNRPAVLLLDHLVVPVGAKVSTELDLPGYNIDHHFPSSLDNLKNLSGFTEIYLKYGRRFVFLRLAGPNGQVRTSSSSSWHSTPEVLLRSLARLDTSKTQRLEIVKGGPIEKSFSVALLPMKDLLTLIISRCNNTLATLLSLDPSFSPDGSVVCPKLEELVLHTHERLYLADMARIAEARASRGSPLKSVKVVGFRRPLLTDGVEGLLRHVSDVQVTRGDDKDAGDSFGESGDEEISFDESSDEEGSSDESSGEGDSSEGSNDEED